jgi:hypothetical protein
MLKNGSAVEGINATYSPVVLMYGRYWRRGSESNGILLMALC